ncbi:MAG: endonuclease III domain-containing protein, partial [Burkholderiales bacterium]
MNPSKRQEIFRRLRDSNPEPKTELEYRTPFELLVSVILSAQATDKSVNIATSELFKHAKTPAEILALGLDGLEPYIKSIGLYRMKAKNIIETCRLLIKDYGGQVPRTR